MDKFAAQMRKMRKKNQLTQKQIGEILGITNSAVAEIESGRSKVLLSHAIKLANYFDVSLDYLCGLSDDKTRK